MAKYVCDYAAVTKAGQDICKAAEALANGVDTYKKNIDSSLSGWQSDSKDVFEYSNNAQAEATLGYAQRIDNLGRFVQLASKAIEDTDNELAQLEI